MQACVTLILLVASLQAIWSCEVFLPKTLTLLSSLLTPSLALISAYSLLPSPPPKNYLKYHPPTPCITHASKNTTVQCTPRNYHSQSPLMLCPPPSHILSHIYLCMSLKSIFPTANWHSQTNLSLLLFTPGSP